MKELREKWNKKAHKMQAPIILSSESTDTKLLCQIALSA